MAIVRAITVLKEPKSIKAAATVPAVKTSKIAKTVM